MLSKLTLTAAAALLSASTCGAFAASDSAAINVSGKIVANSCTLDESGSDLAPVLETVSNRDLKGVGTLAGEKNISVHLTDCGSQAGAVDIIASGTPDDDDSDGYAFKNLSTGSGAASGVGLRFYKTDGSEPFKANGSVTENNTSLKEGDNTLTFKAAYVSTADAPTAGDFTSLVNLTLNYK